MVVLDNTIGLVCEDGTVKAFRGKPISTTEKLAQALEGAGAPREMVAAATAGRYDDYLSDSATPIGDLVRDCRAHGLIALAQRAIDGEFDGTKAEAEAWAKSPQGQQVLHDLRQGR